MSINHHLLAKTTTESILKKFKDGTWKSVLGSGIDYYRTGCKSTFPSPDAAFKDDTNKLLLSFEFKPPTETKRGILTGLGQSIAYLKFSNLSYLVIPEMLGDFHLGSYMEDLFVNQIGDNLPVGLITFDNNNPFIVKLIHNVSISTKPTITKIITNDRYWAKHQDMPIPLFHLLLHCFYLKKTNQINKDPFSYCWDNYMFPISNQKRLIATSVLDVRGNVIKTLSGKKDLSYNEKKITAINNLTGVAKTQKIADFVNKEKSSYVGNGGSMSVRKYCLAFMRHMEVIDSENNLTESGYQLYNVGIIHGPDSKLFKDYFTKSVLLTGHHLDLIFDLEKLANNNKGKLRYSEIKALLYDEYENKGMIKKNPRRVSGATSTVNFLKYEDILWNSLGLKIKSPGKPEIGFNWKKITDVCSLPDFVI